MWLLRSSRVKQRQFWCPAWPQLLCPCSQSPLPAAAEFKGRKHKICTESSCYTTCVSRTHVLSGLALIFLLFNALNKGNIQYSPNQNWSTEEFGGNLAPLRTPIPQLHYLICIPSLESHSFKTRVWYPLSELRQFQRRPSAVLTPILRCFSPANFQVCHQFWIILCSCSGSDSASPQHSQDMDQTPWHCEPTGLAAGSCGHSRLLHVCLLEGFDLTSKSGVLFSSSLQRTAEIHLPLLVREGTSGSPWGWWPRSSARPSSCWGFQF